MKPRTVLSLFLLLTLAILAPAAAQPVEPNVSAYRIPNVTDVLTRSAIAATGANIFEVGKDYVLVETTPREAQAIQRLGLTLEPVSRTVTKLKPLGLSQLPLSYRVNLIDLDQLESLAAGEGGQD